jgi:hypothetical protein
VIPPRSNTSFDLRSQMRRVQGSALDRSDGEGCWYRARGRELLVGRDRCPEFTRSYSGNCLRSGRHPPPPSVLLTLRLCGSRCGFDPLRVRSSDFRPLPGSVQRLEKEPFGFLEFVPEERLDLDLVERMVLAALDEVGSVDVVVLPECAIEESEIAPLEALLARPRRGLSPGWRPRPCDATGGVWQQLDAYGDNPRLEKVGPLPSPSRDPWFHVRQNKHHRWSLDEAQTRWYNLRGALYPDVQWRETMDVPRRSIHFVQVGEEITFVWPIPIRS